MLPPEALMPNYMDAKNRGYPAGAAKFPEWVQVVSFPFLVCMGPRFSSSGCKKVRYSDGSQDTYSQKTSADEVGSLLHYDQS
ncbi:39S ribosomal protein L15 [Cricetulus griseus]|nr:39S ribosomal protein L15 [Cricetulus griseus]